MDNKNNYFVIDDLLYSDAEIKRITRDLKEHGIAEVEHAVQPWVLDAAKHYLEQERKARGTDSLSLRWSDMSECVLTELQKSAPFKKFMSRILNDGGVTAADDDYIHHVIRCTTGLTNSRDGYKFHFDQYNLTVLMPIVTPIDPKLDCGDLVIFPNTRKFSASLIKNLFFKTVFQNSFMRSFASKNWFQRLFNASIVKVKPGNLYVFYGFRSYHGNRSIDPSLLRVTGLFHYHDTFAQNEIIKGLEAYRPRPQDRIGKLAAIKVRLGYLGVLYGGIRKELQKTNTR